MASRTLRTAAGVALITVRAVVHIPVHSRVVEIIGIVPAVATRAREHGIVIRIRMACGADAVGLAVSRWELRVLRVIKRRSSPGGSVVAVLARCREELRLRLVTGICRIVVIRLMAPDALRGQGRVVAIDVAVGASPRRHRM